MAKYGWRSFQRTTHYIRTYDVTSTELNIFSGKGTIMAPSSISENGSTLAGCTPMCQT